MAALSSFALSVLSVEQALDRTRSAQQQDGAPTTTQSATPNRPTRSARRVTSNYNSFQTYCTADNNDPPSYSTAAKQKQAARRCALGQEALPAYSCSVYAEAKVLLNLESINPMHTVSESEWREVYIVVRGSMLNVHRVKDGTISKLLRSYTLQHAEIGLAVDTAYTTLIPSSRLAHLIPGPARQKAFKKDPRLFRAEKQHILRLRIETDQLLFAQPSEEATHNLINAISAAIDISQPIDERSATRQCTVPRRRRRQRPQFNGNVNDATLIADQERIMREMYPGLAATTSNDSAQEQATQSPAREEDEIDVSALREDNQTREHDASTERLMISMGTLQRPVISRVSTQDSIESRFGDDMLYTTASTNFGNDGKWQPPHTRTEAQDLRYTRRCMPILLAEAVRASDVLICDGRRVKINWRIESLDEWELKPPSYRSHGFQRRKVSLERTSSTTSATSESRRSQNGSHDEITPLAPTLSNLDLSKVVSHVEGHNKTETVPRSKDRRRAQLDSMATMQGIVYCF